MGKYFEAEIPPPTVRFSIPVSIFEKISIVNPPSRRNLTFLTQFLLSKENPENPVPKNETQAKIKKKQSAFLFLPIEKEEKDKKDEIKRFDILTNVSIWSPNRCASVKRFN